MSDYGDLCRDLRAAKREARAKYGVPCPVCVERLPKADPTILLPQQTCRMHHYKDRRPRTRETSYMYAVDPAVHAVGNDHARPVDAREGEA